jgi:hypothetical protein
VVPGSYPQHQNTCTHRNIEEAIDIPEPVAENRDPTRNRESGGTGRRAGFRSQWLHCRGGSSPPFRTKTFSSQSTLTGSPLRRLSWVPVTDKWGRSFGTFLGHGTCASPCSEILRPANHLIVTSISRYEAAVWKKNGRPTQPPEGAARLLLRRPPLARLCKSVEMADEP